jgi:class 3 adenylate cyclase
VCDAAKAGQVLVSDPALECVDENGFSRGRRTRLKASGTPRELGTTRVSRGAT